MTTGHGDNRNRTPGIRVITFVTQKGGAGKTTLTVNCAVAAERRARKGC